MTKKELAAANNAKDKVLSQQSDQISKQQEQIDAMVSDKNNNFLQVSKDPGIPMMIVELLNTEGKVYFTLAALANHQNMIQVTTSTLGDILGITSNRVSHCIANLKKLGCLEIIKKGNGNIYVLNPDITWAASNSQRKYCRFEGTTILDEQTARDIEEASARLAQRRKDMIRPNTVG